MSLSQPNFDTLRLIAEMPFLDRPELSAVSGKRQQRVYDETAVLVRTGLVGIVPHSTPLMSHTRRLYVTLEGLRQLAEHDDITIDELLHRYPVSRHSRSLLLERLDAVGVIYRVASSVAWATGPLRLKWYRSEPLDAAITLSDGRTLGIVRQGPTSDRTGFSHRVWRLSEGTFPGGLMVIVPDEVRIRHTSRLFYGSQNFVLLALEEHVAYPSTEDPVWRLETGGRFSLGSMMKYVEPGTLPEEEPLDRPRLPGDIVIPRQGLDVPDHLLPALLSPGEKRVMDTLANWPWITATDIGRLMGVSRARVSQYLERLVKGRIVSSFDEKKRSHLALTDWGLAVVARRDRTSVGSLRKQWSPELSKLGKPADWRYIAGRRSGQLARNLEHTEAVHGFIAQVAKQARERGFQVVQFDPPHRASRHFWHDGKLRSIHPDAFGILRKDGKNLPFFLEWERRAVRPSTMATRLAPYLRYYSSSQPVDDQGVKPLVLMVFDDPLVEARFLGVAREELAKKGIKLPIWISHREALENQGPLGLAWRNPDRLKPARPFG